MPIIIFSKYKIDYIVPHRQEGEIKLLSMAYKDSKSLTVDSPEINPNIYGQRIFFFMVQDTYFFYWSIIALLCWVSFCCTMK